MECLGLDIASLALVDGRKMSDEAVEETRVQGSTDQEIHETALIAAAFCMFNRCVDGPATSAPDDPAQSVMSANT